MQVPTATLPLPFTALTEQDVAPSNIGITSKRFAEQVSPAKPLRAPAGEAVHLVLAGAAVLARDSGCSRRYWCHKSRLRGRRHTRTRSCLRPPCDCRRSRRGRRGTGLRARRGSASRRSLRHRSRSHPTFRPGSTVRRLRRRSAFALVRFGVGPLLASLAGRGSHDLERSKTAGLSSRELATDGWCGTDFSPGVRGSPTNAIRVP